VRRWQTAQAIGHDLDPNRLVSDIGLACRLVERRMGAIVGTQAPGRMKNPPTIMTYTRDPRRMPRAAVANRPVFFRRISVKNDTNSLDFYSCTRYL